MRTLLLITFSLSFTMANAQVEIREPLKFTGTNAADRQIRSLEKPNQEDQALNTVSLQRNSLLFSNASGTGSSLNLSIPMISVYDTGMIIYMGVNQLNMGPATVNINSLGAKPLLKFGTTPLDSADLQPGMVVSAVYDGQAFQVISPLANKCPSGSVAVTKDYCIEVAERDTNSFWFAVSTCYSEGGRLCTMSEWMYACGNSSLGLQGMTNNFEWVDDAANHPTTSKVMGVDQNLVAGCDRGYNRGVTTNQYFRCCFSRKR